MWVERQQETVPPLLQHLSPFDPDSGGVGAGQRRRRRRLLVLCPRFTRAARAMAAAKKMSGQSTRPRRRAAAAAVRPSAGPIRSGNTDAIRSPFVRTQQRNHCVRGLPAGAAAALAGVVASPFRRIAPSFVVSRGRRRHVASRRSIACFHVELYKIVARPTSVQALDDSRGQHIEAAPHLERHCWCSRRQLLLESRKRIEFRQHADRRRGTSTYIAHLFR